MSKVKLIFGTHNGVPSGENDTLFENAYQKAFKPFLTTIYNHTNICPTLFYSGTLLEWLDNHHPEFLEVLAELTASRSLEILGGGYWEPMLPLIPLSDRVGQIELMTTYLRKKFGKRSHGSWVSAQVWEPQLVSSLRTSGMDYVFLTERTFPALPEGGLQSPVIGEDQGKTIVIFPVMDSLTNQFLKVPPEQLVESLHGLYSTEKKEIVVTLILDGLMLGGADSYEVCYGEKWLERFFKAVSASHSWLECVHPRQYLRHARFVRNKSYMMGPTYETLMEWAQPDRRPESGRPQNQLTAASRPLPAYRHFFLKYRESGLLYAKMMHVVVLTNQVRGDKYRKKNAKEGLWRGQEHYAYWHGPSGGIYSSQLRHHAYSALIEAEKATRERGIFKSALTSIDFDMDGEKEFLYNGSNLNAYVHTTGGTLFELDYLPMARNYLATFSRYEEDYHLPEIRERGYDSYPRYAFMDHILQPEGERQDFEEMSFRQNSAFPVLPYTMVEMVRNQPKVSLCVQGPVYTAEDALKINKTYRFRRSSLDVEYTLLQFNSPNPQVLLGIRNQLGPRRRTGQEKGIPQYGIIR